jgi:hypothetical protein
MARTTLTKTTPLGSYGTYGANLADLTLAAADVGNKNQFAAGGNDLIVARNSDGANPYTVTITSAVDPYNRTSDISAYTLQAGEVAVFGPMKLTGWRQSDGMIYLEANNAAILLGVVALP